MNIYVTPDEIKAAAPDMIRSSTTKYDDPLYRRCAGVSRAIDRRCRRFFYPLLATRYFTGPGKGLLWIPDLIAITSVAFSYDDGVTYETLAVTDYIGAVAEDFNRLESYNTLILTVAGNYSKIPKGQRSVRIIGEWGYTDDREAAWEDSGLILAADMAVDAGTFSVTNGSAEDQFGLGTALQLGRLIRIGSELLFITGVTTNTVSVLRARNGSVAAAHDEDDAIELWRPYNGVVEAARIMAIRDLARAQQGYSDARGGMELGGEMVWTNSWDPEALELLRPVIRTSVG